MVGQFKEQGPRLLLVEGKHDCHLISSLCKYYRVPECFKLYDCGSDDMVMRTLAAMLAGSTPMEVIGVVLDADNPGLLGKWAALRTKLIPEGYDVPPRPGRNGTVLSQPEKPVIGVWLMPDNDVDGMLEDFCRRLVDQNAIAYAENCAASARELGFTSFIDNHLSKAAVHTYLAWQDAPGMPLGQALTAKALNPDQPIAELFYRFIMDLFCPDQLKAN